MGYSSVDDLKKIKSEDDLIALTDDEGNGTINADRINEAIDIADREIDAYCSGKYTVPFSSPPEIIKNISAQMAVYHLIARRRDEVEDVWQRKYDNCLKLLKQMQSGAIILAVSGENPDNSVKYTSKTRYFTLETMKNY